MSGIAPIRCQRFQLIPFSVPFMKAVLARDLSAASRELGIRLPAGTDWLEKIDFLFEIRTKQIAARPDDHEWVARGIVLPDRSLVGHIGFHDPPDQDGIAELGYTVFAAWRRMGYAEESARCLMRWARDERGVRRFRVAIAPDNVASLAMAAKLGFIRSGEQIDEIDGIEYTFDLRLD